MKFNKQKIDTLKQKIKNIQEKISSNKNERVPKKYYALLILMLMLGVITLSRNVKEYNKNNHEDFKEYELENDKVISDKIEIKNYITAESSISTYESSKDDTIEVISKNDRVNYIMPINGDVSKEFAVEKLVYSETLGMWKTHPGIDIAALLGTKVKSSSAGIVQQVREDTFYGNTIEILDEKGYVFVYSNLDNEIDLKEGDRIKQGEVIATVGVSATGELADASHLHFEIIKDGKQVNPLDLIN